VCAYSSVQLDKSRVEKEFTEIQLFRIASIDVIIECRGHFGTELPSCLIRKKNKFLSRYNCVENPFCIYCSRL